MILKDLGELPAGEPAALVGLEHRLFDLPQRLLRGINTEAHSRVLDNRQATVYQLCQSMIATRQRKPRDTDRQVMPAVQPGWAG